jgi:hypothetical protein
LPVQFDLPNTQTHSQVERVENSDVTGLPPPEGHRAQPVWRPSSVERGGAEVRTRCGASFTRYANTD